MGGYRGGGYIGTRYRGSRGGGRGIVIVIPVILALLVLGLWFGRGLLFPTAAVEETPEPTPIVTPTPEPPPPPAPLREPPEAGKGV